MVDIYCGSYNTKIDGKGRLIFPSSIGKFEKGTPVYFYSNGESLRIIPHDNFNKFLEDNSGVVPFFKSRKRNSLLEKLFCNFTDNYNRVTIPKEVRKEIRVQLDSEVILLGHGDVIDMKY